MDKVLASQQSAHVNNVSVKIKLTSALQSLADTIDTTNIDNNNNVDTNNQTSNLPELKPDEKISQQV